MILSSRIEVISDAPIENERTAGDAIVAETRGATTALRASCARLRRAMFIAMIYI